MTVDGCQPRPSDVSADELLDIVSAAAVAGARTSLVAWHQRARLAVDTKADLDDLVTEADVRTQAAVFEVLSACRPDDRLRGEEAVVPPVGRIADVGSPVGLEWWVDPIDGTTSFVYGRSDWSVSVAAVDPRDGVIVAAAICEPVHRRLTTAVLGRGTWCDGERLSVGRVRDLARALIEVNLGTHEQRLAAGRAVDLLATHTRDIRRGGSAAAALVGVAAGRADAAWLPGLQQWDGAAGLLIASEAGVTVGDLHGVTGPRWPVSGDVLAAPEPLFDRLRNLLAAAYSLRPRNSGPADVQAYLDET